MKHSFAFFSAAFGVVAFAAGCDNSVIVENGGSGGQSSTSTASKTSGSTMTSGTSMNSGVIASVGSSTDECINLDELGCMGAYPLCGPVYDDTCCPTCNPGACADCSHMQFHHCATIAEICSGAPMMCGFTFPEECSGNPSTCPSAYCPSNPGCVEGCKPDAMGNCSTVCLAVTAGSCTSLCNSPPPPCPPGFVPEQDGSCYTGNCMPEDVCGFIK